MTRTIVFEEQDLTENLEGGTLGDPFVSAAPVFPVYSTPAPDVTYVAGYSGLGLGSSGTPGGYGYASLIRGTPYDAIVYEAGWTPETYYDAIVDYHSIWPTYADFVAALISFGGTLEDGLALITTVPIGQASSESGVLGYSPADTVNCKYLVQQPATPQTSELCGCSLTYFSTDTTLTSVPTTIQVTTTQVAIGYTLPDNSVDSQVLGAADDICGTWIDCSATLDRSAKTFTRSVGSTSSVYDFSGTTAADPQSQIPQIYFSRAAIDNVAIHISHLERPIPDLITVLGVTSDITAGISPGRQIFYSG